MKVWVVMDKLAIDDDGDEDIAIAAVHASKEGAQGNLIPDGTCGDKFTSKRVRYVVEMELLP